MIDVPVSMTAEYVGLESQICPIRQESIEFEKKLQTFFDENQCEYSPTSMQVFNFAVVTIFKESKDQYETAKHLRKHFESIEKVYLNEKNKNEEQNE